MKTMEQNDVKFSDLGISARILEVLKKLNLEVPTPIQRKSIPVALEGKDLIGIAQTGTGKTFAFGIPMIERIATTKGRGLILLPTRELALQVDENLRKIGAPLGLRTAVLIGGEPIGKQMHMLRNNPHIVVATPGRLIDHLKRRMIRLNEVKVLVLDEADMMFDMGFAPQIEEIIAQVPKDRQTVLFSATMPHAIAKLTEKHMALPISIEVAPQGTTAENVDQEMFIVRKDDKLNQLEKILKEHRGSILVFSRTKHGAKALNLSIQSMGHKAAEIHSNRSFGQRREALAGFKSNKYRILIATDIAARGIDVSGIELVVNYDLPDNSEDYVHRIGRTGRAGNQGKAISFATPDQGRDIKNIERLINKNLALTKFAELDQRQSDSSRPRRGRSFPSRKFGNRSGESRPFRGNSDRSGEDKSFRGNGNRSGENRTFRSNSDRPADNKSFGGNKRNFKRPGRPQRAEDNSVFTPAPMTDKQRFRASLRQAEGPRQGRVAGNRRNNNRGRSNAKPS
ncbi:MAG: DEAD/DEAH box helicase [Patescibacteria group bacterium]